MGLCDSAEWIWTKSLSKVLEVFLKKWQMKRYRIHVISIKAKGNQACKTWNPWWEGTAWDFWRSVVADSLFFLLGNSEEWGRGREMGWRGLATCHKELWEIGQFLSCMAWSPGWQAPSVQLGLLQLRRWLSLFHPPISKNRSGKRCGSRSYARSAITNLIRIF